MAERTIPDELAEQEEVEPHAPTDQGPSEANGDF